MKVMIAYPPLDKPGKVPLLSQNRQFQWFSNPTFLYPLVPASAATLLKAKGFDVLWCDAIAEQSTYPAFLDSFAAQAPDVAVIETKTPVVKRHWRIIGEMKQRSPRTRFVLLGDHVTALPQESFHECPDLDYVITGGDYDFSLLALSQSLKEGTDLPPGVWCRQDGKPRFTGVPRQEYDLNTLPFVDRDFTKFHLYEEANIKRRPFAYTMAGRDCPYHKCRFCSWTTLFPKFHVRSPESLIDEIGMLIDKYGVREIFDDTGTFPSGGWLDRFCELMVARGYNKKVLVSCNFRFDYLRDPATARMMKKAGFRLVKSGLESANQSTLDRLDKGVKVEDIVNGCRNATNAGLSVHLTMMVGFPWETREEALNTLSLARHLMSKGLAEVLQSTVVIPYPGTPLHEEAVKSGWFRIDPKDYDRYDMTEPVLTAGSMTPDEVMRICDEIYKVYLTPGYMYHRLAHLRSWDDVKFYANGFKAVTRHIRDFARGK